MLKTMKIGDYNVLGTLGQGAGSTIYEVSRDGGEQRQALKLVTVSRPEEKRFVDQLDTERECSLAVSHPAVRRCSDLVKSSKFLRVTEAYLVMEYVEGRSLADHRPESMADLVAVFVEVAEALAAIHAAGYVHADIKPANILVAPSGRVKVIDLGQSCKVGSIKERVQGTPDYISPEQVKRRPLNAQTDMFNFGATMYWCVTGTNIPTLIPGDEAPQPSHKGKGYSRPIKINPEVPPLLDRLIGDCLRTRQGNRPEHWDVVLERLKLTHLLLQHHDSPQPTTVEPKTLQRSCAT